MTITVSEVEDRLEEAALTLRRLPDPPGSGPRGYGSSWPEYVRDPRHAYGYHEARMRVVPSPAQIARMEDCLDWLRLVGPEDARIVWLRANGLRWRQVCIMAGCVRQTAWRRWAAALLTIANRLNAKKKSPPRPRPVEKGMARAAPRLAENGARTLF
jgi:hypothetical protein